MPDGAPKRETPADIRSLARGYTNVSLKTLGGIAGAGKSEAARVAAAIALLDRGYGKPQQDTQITGSIEVILRDIMAEKQKQQT